MRRCDCCGNPTLEELSVATPKSERLLVRMTGFESRLDGVNLALQELRAEKRRLTTDTTTT